jgi:tRNA threonylcarbamoyladenosine biosynthesis protein TsaB
MRLLALDTATGAASVALLEGDAVVGEVRLRTTTNPSTFLLPAVAFLLEGAGWAPGEIDAFAVTLGPGSFTGLRVGISTIQGLALARGAKTLGLSTLDVLAARIRGAAPRIVAAVDAYRGQVFTAEYGPSGERLREPALLEAGEFVGSLPADAALVGDAVERHREAILARGPFRIPERSSFLAGTLARLAAPALARGEGVPPNALAPLYLREADIRP